MPPPIPVATPAFGYRLCYANFDPVAFAVIRGRPEQFIDEMDAPLFGAAFSPDQRQYRSKKFETAARQRRPKTDIEPDSVPPIDFEVLF